jgi:hypothetical protein
MYLTKSHPYTFMLAGDFHILEYDSDNEHFLSFIRECIQIEKAYGGRRYGGCDYRSTRIMQAFLGDRVLARK